MNADNCQFLKCLKTDGVKLVGLGEDCSLCLSSDQQTVENVENAWPPHGSVITNVPLCFMDPCGFCLQVDLVHDGIPSVSIGVFLPDKRRVSPLISEERILTHLGGTVWSWNMRSVSKTHFPVAACQTICPYYTPNKPELHACSTIGVYRETISGALHFTLNGRDLGVAVSKVPADVYGWLRISTYNGQGLVKMSLFPEIALEYKRKITKPIKIKKPRPRDTCHCGSEEAEEVKPYTIHLPCTYIMDRLNKKKQLPNTVPAVSTLEKREKVSVAQQTEACGPEPQQKSPELCCYSMTRQPRGICLIINNVEFDDNNKNRAGTKADANALHHLFRDLHFKVDKKTNLTARKMELLLLKYSCADHTNYDAFICVILSHGGDGDIIQGVDGECVKIRDLMDSIDPVKCPTLRGKPKLFFVQACRGHEWEKAEKYCPSRSAPTEWQSSSSTWNPFSFEDEIEARNLVPDSTLARALCPMGADFLLAYATTPGHTALRRDGEGSFFVMEFVEAMRKFGSSCHILEILTEAKRKVVEEVEAESGGQCWQMAASHDTLRALLYL